MEVGINRQSQVGRMVQALPGKGWDRAEGDEDNTLLDKCAASLAWVWLPRLQEPSALLGNKDNI